MAWGALELLSARKDFAGAWVGSPTLNRLGLHPARIALADACLRLRRLQRARPPEADALARDGVAVVPGFLPADEHAAVRREVRARVDALERAHPFPPATERGFGARQPFDGGFDRYDGGTLNRFVTLDETVTPRAHALARSARLARIAGWAAGFRHQPSRMWIYQTVHGDEARNPDVQKALHRDTFHSTIKLWLFLDDVAFDDGPFAYVPGSHRMSPARYRWEQARARAASAPDATRRGGAFRIDEAELPALGLPRPRTYPVAANTLVIADTRGFHRRSRAHPGARRLALYASLRAWPFSPIAY